MMQEDFKVSLMEAIANKLAKSDGRNIEMDKGLEEISSFLKGISQGKLRNTWFTHTMMLALDKTRGTQTFNGKFQEYAKESNDPYNENMVNPFEVSYDTLYAKTPDDNWMLFFESGRLMISSDIHGEYVLEDMYSVRNKKHYLNVYKNHTDVFASAEVTALIAMSLLLV